MAKKFQKGDTMTGPSDRPKPLKPEGRQLSEDELSGRKFHDWATSEEGQRAWDRGVDDYYDKHVERIFGVKTGPMSDEDLVKEKVRWFQEQEAARNRGAQARPAPSDQLTPEEMEKLEWSDARRRAHEVEEDWHAREGIRRQSEHQFPEYEGVREPPPAGVDPHDPRPISPSERVFSDRARKDKAESFKRIFDKEIEKGRQRVSHPLGHDAELGSSPVEWAAKTGMANAVMPAGMAAGGALANIIASGGIAGLGAVGGMKRAAEYVWEKSRDTASKEPKSGTPFRPGLDHGDESTETAKKRAATSFAEASARKLETHGAGYRPSGSREDEDGVGTRSKEEPELLERVPDPKRRERERAVLGPGHTRRPR